MDDPHTVLGVEKGASKNEIRRKYKAAAAQCDPARGGDIEQFKRLRLAYKILINSVGDWISTNCPHCKKRVLFKRDETEATCRCGAHLKFPTLPSSSIQYETNDQNEDADSSRHERAVIVICPKCGNRLSLTGRQKKARCDCGAKLRLRSAELGSRKKPPKSKREKTARPAKAKAPAPAKPSGRKSASLKKRRRKSRWQGVRLAFLGTQLFIGAVAGIAVGFTVIYVLRAKYGIDSGVIDSVDEFLMGAGDAPNHEGRPTSKTVAPPEQDTTEPIKNSDDKLTAADASTDRNAAGSD